MSAPVDVLAVMRSLNLAEPTQRALLNQAIAAVEDLVWATEKVQAQVAPLLKSNGYGYVGAMEAQRIALARAKGGAA